ncbi:ABC transporter permease [Salirhabdus sp. Marseille-P4669]|uniref:ABC transporter permease n=1 Tax=Salirhabdus sp. Marseille-P4669 TaxID=2042310 RepID=UPI000C7AECC0|nr:ABC transporter permease [Salirhabdus sp. Marseille-P4669]
MLTFLIQLNKLIHQNKWKVLFTLFFPFFLLWALYPFISNTVEQTNVPIGIVNGDKSEFAQIVTERVDKHPRLQVVPLQIEEANKAVMTGNVEATFLFDIHFEENIRAGKIKDQIKWIRTENSFFDTFAKEKLASEVMRLSLNSVAANEIQLQEQVFDDVKWEQSFEHAESYWEPEPLFMVEFIPYISTTEKGDNQEQLDSTTPISLGFIGFWYFYIWIVFGLLNIQLYTWREKGILQRIQLVKGSLVPFYQSFYLSTIVFALVLFICINLATPFVLEGYDETILSQMPGILGILCMTFMVTILFGHFVKNRNQFFVLIMVYSMCSFTFSVFAVISEANDWYYYLLPHVWLYEILL